MKHQIKLMKKVITLLVLIVSVNTVFSQHIKKVKIADVVKMMDTSSVPMVINFWATWCGPCVHEIPWFEKAVAELKDKKVQLILVSLDFRDAYPKELTAFVKKNAYTSKILWLDETDADLFCPLIDKNWNGNIPATIMINNKKNYHQFYGEQIQEPRLKLELQKLVN